MKEIFVYADWVGIDGPLFMGTLSTERLKGNEIFSFSYNQTWLDSGQVQSLDPDNSLNFDLCMDVHQFFRWEKDEAKKELERIKEIRSSWEMRASRLSLRRSEIALIRTAFERAE